MRWRLGEMEFRRVVWIIPAVFLLHELEEWNILAWYREYFSEMPVLTDNADFRAWIIGVSIFAFLWTWISTRFKNERITAYLVIPPVVLILANGIQHLFWLFYFQAYAPGVIFASLLGIPACSYVLYRGVRGVKIPLWYPLLFSLYGLFIVVTTVVAGSRLSPFIRTIMDLAHLTTSRIF
ncbi:MAG: HXXEE domain-containing protein [Spirochaetes bacterium]|nr:HXXEE domain-containing protein [Spirochaetota bacterium]